MTTAMETALLETFDSGTSGASLSFPLQCSALRHNGFVLIKGEPCKLVQIDSSKTGKHGGAKMHVVALNIFNGKKVETMFMSTDNCEVPNVDRKEYQLVDIDSDGYLSLYDEGHPKNDLRIGSTGIDAELRAAFQDGKDLLVTVQSAMGKEGVFSFKEDRAV